MVYNGTHFEPIQKMLLTGGTENRCSYTNFWSFKNAEKNEGSNPQKKEPKAQVDSSTFVFFWIPLFLNKFEINIEDLTIQSIHFGNTPYLEDNKNWK